MKLVETDIPHGDSEDDASAEVPRPPRPEHRRVYVSLFLTLSVLAATVLTVYTLFPKRDNELLTSAMDAHRDPSRLQIERPNPNELDAWTIGVIGERIEWPMPSAERQVMGALAMRVLRRPAALVRYRIGQAEVTLVALRARDAPPRRYRRSNNGLVAVSWRDGPWTFVAIGPSESEQVWRAGLDAP